MRNRNSIPVIGVVGPCAAGKTTLIHGLMKHEIVARHIAQEHSYVPHMWQRITNPDVLIFLDVSFDETLRRKKLNWTSAEYKEQQRRLQHAREHQDLLINTDSMKPSEILHIVLEFLTEHYPLLTSSH